MNRPRLAKRIGLGVVVLLVLAQVVPYGHRHENPPVTREAPWPDARSRALALRACYGCHSNETHWPWYAHVAPASWLVASDVSEGRETLNFSEWDRPQKHAQHAAKEVRDGDMPPWVYRLGHSEARLSSADEGALVTALEALAAGRPAAEKLEAEHEHED